MGNESKKMMYPLWLKFPFMTRYCIGWRMGSGEAYKFELGEWLQALSKQDRERWEKMFPKPPMWQDCYDDDSNTSAADVFAYHNYAVQFWRPFGKPAYALPQLQEDIQRSTQLNFLFFWGHTALREDCIDRSCLSQWFLAPFQVDEHYYQCAEQYMMAEKARLFDDQCAEQAILQAKTAKEMKAIGRQVKDFHEAAWNQAKYTIVLTANYYKFLQNPKLLDYLLSTKTKVLVEASPYDKVWGIGMGVGNGKINDPRCWKGENLLGFALMEVRDVLRDVCQYMTTS